MGDIEKAKRDLRWAKSSADDRRWDQLEPKLQTIEAALQGCSDAEKAPILAEIAPMREAMVKGVREEKSGRIEREIKRNLGAATSEIQSGYKDPPNLQKSIDRLASAEAQEWLLPEAVAAIQKEIAEVQAKLPASQAPKPAPAKAAPPAEAPAPKAATPAPAPAAKPAAPAGADPDRARSIENDCVRTLKFAADDVSRNPDQADSKAERVLSQLDSDEGRRHLAPETIERLRAQAVDLKSQVDAARLADKISRIEEQIGRYLRNAESDLSHNPRGAGDMLRHSRERLDSEEAKQLLPAATTSRVRSEIARIQALIAAAGKRTALDNAGPILKELEERVEQPIFDGSQPAWRALGDLDSLKVRVRGALFELPKDDPDVKAIEARIAAVDARIAAATSKLGRDEAFEQLNRAWEVDRDAIEGWEEEAGKDYELPKTALAVRRLTWFLKGNDIERLRSEFKGDKEIQAIVKGAEKALEAATAKLYAAFDAALTALEKQPRPSNRIDLEQPSRLAGRAGSEFEGTKHAEAAVKRATALYDRWQAEIAKDRAKREAKYKELSAVADKAWPAIVSSIKAEAGFDPLDAASKGKTVLLKEIRNRIGWDFSGKYDFAIWVGETPVVGNYDKHVMDAVNEACEKCGLPLDDHTDWDAVITVGAPGKIKQRFNIVVRDRNNLEIGKIEEWRPVDCVMCTVIALHAGPAAVGPKKGK